MKAALVTGGARRIGAAIVMRLAEAGYAVAIHANTSAEEAHSLSATLAETGVNASVVTGDLTDPGAPDAIIAAASTALGPLDLLVNNAAIFADDGVATLTGDSFDRHMAVNLRAPLLLAQAFAAQAAPGAQAAIVNILDQRVLKPTPDHLSYALSKAGLHAATRMLAQALAPGIRVNAIAPGPTLPNQQDGSAGFERETAVIALQRPVPPREIADAVLYLAQAGSVTGQTIAVDGGQNIGWRTPDVVALEDPSGQRDR
jgi:NAD(P)-dependent dehydrogenase (short-subunit alcohol dehydrogenase family)